MKKLDIKSLGTIKGGNGGCKPPPPPCGGGRGCGKSC